MNSNIYPQTFRQGWDREDKPSNALQLIPYEPIWPNVAHLIALRMGKITFLESYIYMKVVFKYKINKYLNSMIKKTHRIRIPITISNCIFTMMVSDS